MPVVILAGGMGTRLREETAVRPSRWSRSAAGPILWHIMKHYAHYGFDDSSSPSATRASDQGVLPRLSRTATRDFTVDLAAASVDSPRRCAARTGPSRSSRPAPTRMTGGRIRRLARLSSTAGSWSPTATASRTSTSTQLLAFHERTAGWRRHRRAPAGALRRDRARRRPGHGVLREAADRHRLDQRRLLRLRAPRSSTTSTATRRPRARAAGALAPRAS